MKKLARVTVRSYWASFTDKQELHHEATARAISSNKLIARVTSVDANAARGEVYDTAAENGYTVKES